ncbi:hypothetical protein V322_02318, partial [Staphylococcus aureus F19466]
AMVKFAQKMKETTYQAKLLLQIH